MSAQAQCSGSEGDLVLSEEYKSSDKLVAFSVSSSGADPTLGENQLSAPVISSLCSVKGCRGSLHCSL